MLQVVDVDVPFRNEHSKLILSTLTSYESLYYSPQQKKAYLDKVENSILINGYKHKYL